MLRGTKVILRAPSRDNIPTYVRWFNDPEVTQYLGRDMWPMSLEAEEHWFSRMVEGDARILGIQTIPAEGQAGVLIGSIGLHDVDTRSGHAELGIVIGEKEYWNRGYGSDAIVTMLRYAFDELNLHRVYLRVYGFNARGIHAYEKCGFRTEGRQREHLYRNGAWHDEIIMGILRDEFRALHAR